MTWHTLRKSTVVLSALSLGALACADVESTGGEVAPTVEGTTPGTLANVIATDPRLTVLATALDQTGLLATLDDASQSLTVFAPVDAAFNTLPNDVIASSNFVSTGDPGLLNIGVSDAELTTILQAHVVAGAQDAAAVTGASTLDSLASGSVITVTNVDPTPENRPGDEMDTFPVLSGRVQLLQTDIVASNGVIHVVDAVFIPSADPFPGNLFELIEATPLFQPFFALLRAAGLDSTIADFNTDDVQNTVFMPAFGLEGAESADTARGHVFPGTTLASAVVAAAGTDIENMATLARYAIGADGPTIEGTTIAFTDLRASNGVVHLTLGPVSQPDDTVADIITTTGDLSSLRDALTAIEPDGSEFDPETSTQSLLDVLRADEMTTLFAPNNAAFAALAGIDADLNGDEPEDDPEDDMDITDNAAELIALGELDEVLTYHVTPAGTVVNAMSADGDFATRNGSTATLGRFTIGTSTVLTVNGYIEVVSSLRTANGSMVHTIGNVLVPAGLSTLPVLNENFPGSSQEAIEYFTFFTGYAGLTDNSFPINLTAGSGTETFGGTLSDLLSFIAGDDSFEVGMGEDFAGQLIAPYSVDTNEDGTPDANFTIPEVTVFVPVTQAFPESVPDFVFDVDNDDFAATDIAPFHIVDGNVLAADIMDGVMIPTYALTKADATAMPPVAGGDIGLFDITIDTTTLVVDGGGTTGTIIGTDLETANGVIHLIDGVLSPAATPE